MGKPENRCEDCGGLIREGDEVVYVEDTDRVWHVRCFEENLTPIEEWPKAAETTEAR